MLLKTKKNIVTVIREFVMHRTPFFSEAVFSNSAHVLLFPQVKCAYNRIKKSANSSTTMFMADALTSSGPVIQSGESCGDTYHAYKNKCIGHGISLSKVWRPDQLLNLQEFFWFTVVRNPYSRVLSAYLQKGLDAQRKSKNLTTPGFKSLNSQGFKSFIHFLQDGGLYSDKHYWPQHELLFMPLARYDYVAHTERLEADMKYIFEKINLTSNRSFGKPHEAEISAQWKVTNASSRIFEFYDEEIHQIVSELYQTDFEKFGYPQALT